ncbi:MAG: hypothetical protein P1U89_19120 [Verrucomicrobiales bacterium]|nr:hypothetical protein [Verrucomicrobiales bacterium]
MENLLPHDLTEATKLALKDLGDNPDQSRADIFYTRDFWDDDWDDSDMEAAYELASKKSKDTSLILAEIFGHEAQLIRRKDSGFEWFKAENGHYWETEFGHIILFWEHEDKELPCVVQLYRYMSPEYHEMKISFDENAHIDHLYYGTSDEEKIMMLESESTTDSDWIWLYEYCRSFPRKKVIEAARKNLDRLKEIPSYYTREMMDALLDESLEEVKQWGDACHHGTDEDLERLESMNESELIAYLDSNETDNLWFRAGAILKVYEYPSEAMIAAVKRNWHKPYDRKQVPELDVLIAVARNEDW